MAIASKQFLKMSLLVMSLFAFAACSSTSGDDEGAAGSQSGTSSSSTSGSSANSNAGSGNRQPSAAEMARDNALRTRIFYFDFDVAEFHAEDRETLTYHARDLASNPGKRIRLEGHADERGTREYNLALGERRANGIMNFFIVNGASRAQIEVVSYGEERPAAQGQTEAAYARNRRVEIIDR